MTESSSSEIPKGIDAARGTAWYAANVAGAQPPLTFSIIASGHSNLTYRVTDAGGKRSVLRRPPLGALLATAHDMGREHKILYALANTDVPVAPVLGQTEEASVEIVRTTPALRPAPAKDELLSSSPDQALPHRSQRFIRALTGK